VILFYAVRGVEPVRILQAVAAGLLGPAAFKGGLQTAAIGMGMHTLIAFVVVCVYHLASTHMAVLTRHPMWCGAMYGLLVWAVMNFVVLPNFSATGAPKFLWPAVVNGLFAHVFCVGIPAALSTRWRPATALRYAR
jgi:hypothetical protein